MFRLFQMTALRARMHWLMRVHRPSVAFEAELVLPRQMIASLRWRNQPACVDQIAFHSRPLPAGFTSFYSRRDTVEDFSENLRIAGERGGERLLLGPLPNQLLFRGHRQSPRIFRA